MTENPPDHARKPQPSAGRFAGIVAVFVVIGPLVGGLAVAILLATLAASSDLAVEGWLERGRMFFGAMMLGVVFGLPLSYILGGAPGLLIGVATAAWDAHKGTISLPVVLGGAWLLGILAALRQDNSAWASEGDRIAQIALLLAHLIAAGVCWLIARAIFGWQDISNISDPGENQ